MLLKRVKVEGYRSLRQPMDLYVDRDVTVVLGANDHGKSNLLAAISHLNPGDGFDADDLNWDRSDDGKTFPAVEYELSLSEAEREQMREIERWKREEAQLQELRHAVESERDGAIDLEAERRTAVGKAEEGLEDLAARAEGGDDEAASAITAAKRMLGQATKAHEASQQAFDDAQRRTDLVRLGLLEVHAELKFEDPKEAIALKLESALEAHNRAQLSLEQSKAGETSARKALAALENQGHPEGSDEHSTASKALSDATASLQKIERNARARAAAMRELKRITALSEEFPTAEERPIKLPAEEPVSLKEIPTTVTLSRVGLHGALTLEHTDTGILVDDYVLARLPKVYAVEPQDRIPDSATAGNIDDFSHAFMRGIFHYAGLEPKEWKALFAQSDRTSRRLDDASATLNNALRESWSQGERLEFRLQHNASSSSKKIELVIKDPAVRDRYVRASRRSSGFTHFFALKTILYALQKEAPASAYFWVFDEPGIHLHPDGQHDLVKVMETLAQTNQVTYTTHSVFMASKNFPARHRLVVKTKGGTQIDGKPFRSRWRPAIDALGMSLPGTFLFASHVLLVEGDSDSILLNATFQKLLELGQFDHDVTSLSIMPAGDSADAAALVRILRESSAGPRIHAVFDGDAGGKQRKAALDGLGLSDLPVHCLGHGTTTEDHLPGGKELYLESVATYLGKLDTGIGEDPTSAASAFAEELLERASNADLTTGGLAAWTRATAQDMAKLEYKPSPVGIAREYAILLENRSLDDLGGVQKGIGDARKLCRSIAKTLDLPSLTLSEDAILEGNDLDELA